MQQEKDLVGQQLADEKSQHHEMQSLILDFIRDLRAKDDGLAQEDFNAENYNVNAVSQMLDKVLTRVQTGLGGVDKSVVHQQVSCPTLQCDGAFSLGQRCASRLLLDLTTLLKVTFERKWFTLFVPRPWGNVFWQVRVGRLSTCLQVLLLPAGVHCIASGGVLKERIFFLLRTAPRDHQPPTANRHQPPATNCR